MQKKIPWVGGALILVGVLLLVHRLGYLAVHWHDIGWGLLALFGVVKIVNGFSSHATGTTFWGTALLLIGLTGLLRPLHLPAFYSLSGVSVVLLILGTSFLVAFLSNIHEWHFVIPSLFFTGLGLLFAASDHYYISRWEIIDTVGTYWPLALVLFGVSLLLNRRQA